MSPNDTAENEKMEEESIKKENCSNLKLELRLDFNNEPGLLWEGEVRFKTEEQREEIQAPVQIFHKDDSKNGCKLFDWVPHGKLC